MGAFSKGQLIATCNAAVIPNLTRGGRPFAIVENVWTRPDSRRRGVGSALLQELLTKTKEKTYGAIAIAEADTFQSPFPETEFPCLLWDHEGRFNSLERSKVAQALLDADCRYVVCGGANCENWYDSVDEEFIHRHLEDSEEACEAEHVMTTWHTGEAADALS